MLSTVILKNFAVSLTSILLEIPLDVCFLLAAAKCNKLSACLHDREDTFAFVITSYGETRVLLHPQGALK